MFGVSGHRFLLWIYGYEDARRLGPYRSSQLLSASGCAARVFRLAYSRASDISHKNAPAPGSGELVLGPEDWGVDKVEASALYFSVMPSRIGNFFSNPRAVCCAQALRKTVLLVSFVTAPGHVHYTVTRSIGVQG
jgi:hypothetical protein